MEWEIDIYFISILLMNIISIYNALDEIPYFNKLDNNHGQYFVIGYGDDVQIIRVYTCTTTYEKAEWRDLLAYNISRKSAGHPRYELSYTGYGREYCAICGLEEISYVHFEAGTCSKCLKFYNNAEFDRLRHIPTAILATNPPTQILAMYSEQKMMIWAETNIIAHDITEHSEYEIKIISQERLIIEVGQCDIVVCEVISRQYRRRALLISGSELVADIVREIYQKLVLLSW